MTDNELFLHSVYDKVYVYCIVSFIELCFLSELSYHIIHGLNSQDLANQLCSMITPSTHPFESVVGTLHY